MATAFDSLYFQAATGDTPISETARLFRLLPDAVFPTAGVVNAGDLVVSQHAAGANFTVDIAPGIAVVAGTSSTAQGKYVGRNVAIQSVTIGAAPASGTRTDGVFVQVQDSQVDSSGAYQVIPVVVAGPDSAGTPPTTPANALLLAYVAIATGAGSITNANIADKRVYAGTGGWMPYTPAWTGASANPTIGNGTITGRYKQNGKTIHAQAQILAGSTTNFGAGVMSLGLPVASSASQPGSAVGRVFANNSGVYFTNGTLLLNASSTAAGIYLPSSTTASSLVQAAYGTPWNFKAADSFSFTITYEAA